MFQSVGIFKINRASIKKSQYLKSFFNKSINMNEKIHVKMKENP